jgi:hypothetical protein
MALPRPKKLKEKAQPQSVEAYVTGNSIDYSLSNLSKLSLDELAGRYQEIDEQAQFLKGTILLEARSRFASNIEFGNWIQSIHALSVDAQQTRTKYMNFARYFKNKDRTGMPLTVCYEISAPINADIADKVYQAALNKNLSVAQIKAEIAKAKGLLPESVNEGSGEPELMPLEDISSFMEQVLADVQQLPVNEAIRVLKECLKKLNQKTQ